MKKKKSSGGGGANWMDTYGDMVTLLLCFFVLLYSMSTISEENWKALVMSFNPDAVQTPTQTSGNDGPNADPNEEDATGLADMQAEIDQNMEDLYEAIQAYVNSQGAQSTISVAKDGGKVFVSFNQAVFFDGDDWALRPESKPILDTIGGMLSEVGDSVDEVRVIGHTAQGDPNSPNDPKVDRLLSAQRSANVVAYIQTHSTVEPARMISEGCGQWRPVSENDTPEGRAKNRRVEMIVSGRDIAAEMGDSVQQYHT